MFLKKSIDTLLNELQLLVFKKGRFGFQGETDKFLFLAKSVHRHCVAGTVSKNIVIERCSSDEKLLIETMMEEIENVVLEGIDFAYQEESYKHAKIDNFCKLIFCSEEQSAILDSRLAPHK